MDQPRNDGGSAIRMAVSTETKILEQIQTDPDTGWTTIIRPQKGLFDVRLKQLWRYRDLIGLFVWRDFIAVYKQTILGPLWHVIQPLLTSVMFTAVFGNIARLSTDGLPKFLFYLAGNVI